MSSLYYCTKENNPCPKKESCKRYLESENECTAPLFARACTESNRYILFLRKEETNNDV